MDTRFEISETKEHGAILRINDAELADEFDDFINEDCYVFTELKFETDCVCFYFGQAGCIEKIRDLIERFVNKS
ncbi:MAG: hypothetical protein V3V12_08895 [Gammaproteobacteria bacterium]